MSNKLITDVSAFKLPTCPNVSLYQHLEMNIHLRLTLQINHGSYSFDYMLITITYSQRARHSDWYSLPLAPQTGLPPEHLLLQHVLPEHGPSHAFVVELQRTNDEFLEYPSSGTLKVKGQIIKSLGSKKTEGF